MLVISPNSSETYQLLLGPRSVDVEIWTGDQLSAEKVRESSVLDCVYRGTGDILHEMRVIKTPDEIARLRRSAAITGEGHIAAMRATRPGLREYQIQAILQYAYKVGGAQYVWHPSIVAAGKNPTILRYSKNSAELRDGDCWLVDSGAEVDLYACDVTRTWPVSGTCTAEQRAIYGIVLGAQRAAIAEIRSG